jgi:hypothetical protein
MTRGRKEGSLTPVRWRGKREESGLEGREDVLREWKVESKAAVLDRDRNGRCVGVSGMVETKIDRWGRGRTRERTTTTRSRTKIPPAKTKIGGITKKKIRMRDKPEE